MKSAWITTFDPLQSFLGAKHMPLTTSYIKYIRQNNVHANQVVISFTGAIEACNGA